MAPRQRAGSAREAVVVVTGDVTMDWNLACTRGSEGVEPDWHSDARTRACWQRGGAALLADLIEALAEPHAPGRRAALSDLAAGHPSHPRPGLAGDPRYHHFYSNWSVFRYSVKSPQDGEKPAWRVAEVLGPGPLPGWRAADDSDGDTWSDDTPEADLVVLDDADLGFRDHPELWPLALTWRGQAVPGSCSRWPGPWPRVRCGSTCTGTSRTA